MLFLYRFFCGVLEVEFYGIYPEKVLNICSKSGINIWSARYVKQRIRCKMLVKDFLKLPAILRKSGIRVHIIDKKGFPFFIKRYNKRFGVFSGIIVFFVFLYVMSGHIWVIEVEGLKTVKEQEIIASCQELGIHTGMSSKNIKAKALAQELLLKCDKLAWASLNVEGSCLTVNVTEIKQKQEDNSVPCNLVSTSDGIITHIDVTAGNCLVKVGDVVSKGDVLVSGIIENQSGTKFVHSIGKIKADCETEILLEQALNSKVKYPTGKIKEKSVLEFFGIKIPLYIGSEKGKYTFTLHKKQATLFSRKLPITLYTKRFAFYKESTQQLSYDKACDMLDSKLAKQYNGKIKEKEFLQNEDTAILKAVILENKEITTGGNIMIG